MSDGGRILRRSFLNRRGHHEGAYVLAEMRRGAMSAGTLTISDCLRQVTLEFSRHDRAAVRNSIYKADVLLRTVGALRDELERNLGAAESATGEGARARASPELLVSDD